MKLFRCRQCGTIDNSALSYILVHISVRIAVGKEEFYADGDFPSGIYERPVRLAEKGFRCHNCDSSNIAIVTLNECPHSWDSFTYAAERHCRWCSKIEKGKIIFEEK